MDNVRTELRNMSIREVWECLSERTKKLNIERNRLRAKKQEVVELSGNVKDFLSERDNAIVYALSVGITATKISELVGLEVHSIYHICMKHTNMSSSKLKEVTSQNFSPVIKKATKKIVPQPKPDIEEYDFEELMGAKETY